MRIKIHNKKVVITTCIGLPDYLRLGENGHFSANQPNNSLLTVAQPEAFGFLGDNLAPIFIQGSFIKVPETETLSIIGGDIEIEDGSLYAPSGRINLVSVASMGEVNFNYPNWLTVESFNKLGKITLSEAYLLKRMQESSANIDVSGEEGGQVFIRSGQFLLDAGSIFSDSYGNGWGLGIDISIDEEMYLTNGAIIATDSLGNGRGSDIQVTTKILRLSGNNQEVENFFVGIGQNETNAFINSFNFITTNSFAFRTEALSNSGNIQIKAQQVILDNGVISTALRNGGGEAGNIDVLATDIISLSNFSMITAGSDDNSNGDAGNIYLSTFQLNLNYGEISSFSLGTGNAGSIQIRADNVLLTDNSIIRTDAYQAGSGNITFNIRDSFDLFDSKITAEAKGIEPHHSGGNITISHPAIFTLDNSRILANAYAGKGGNIDISTDNLNVLGNSWIDVSSVLGLNGGLMVNSIKPYDDYMRLPPPWFLAGSLLLLEHCAGLSREGLSRFFIVGRDVPKTSPYDLQTHSILLSHPLSDWELEELEEHF